MSDNQSTSTGQGSASQQTQPEVPETGHGKIPLWIKLMWIGGVLWVLWYVYNGLQSTPSTWIK